MSLYNLIERTSSLYELYFVAFLCFLTNDSKMIFLINVIHHKLFK